MPNLSEKVLDLDEKVINLGKKSTNLGGKVTKHDGNGTGILQRNALNRMIKPLSELKWSVGFMK